ncbi:MAG: hypothetical protein ACLU6P_18930 [Roseburia intestinalis]
MMVLKFRKQESSYDDRWQATNMVVPVNPHVLIQSTKEPVHLAMKANPRLINIPPRGNVKEKNTMQELLLNARISVRK